MAALCSPSPNTASQSPQGLESVPEVSADKLFTFPQELSPQYQLRQSLRYGENPHQRAAFYVDPAAHASTLAAAQVLHGKELSYNNLLDLDAAMQIVPEFDRPAAVVIKHNNPCGCAVAADLASAYEAADAGDPVSAFGSIIGLNRVVDVATAEAFCVPGRFIEAIVAPGYEPAALEILTTTPRWKASVRLIEVPGMLTERPLAQEVRFVTGGLLIQDRDEVPEDETKWRIVTVRQPTPAELVDLKFAWKVCKHVKSNAILLAHGGSVIGVGAGQMSRLDSAWIACHKAGARSPGAVCASDAFFPFRDGIDQLASAGIRAIIQPGGSKRDDEVTAACDELGMAMIFTGHRHFRH
jgi:phosphoribosylaminoimidazolecarboxamide formyltransferase/IMP cyclohydrolase